MWDGEWLMKMGLQWDKYHDEESFQFVWGFALLSTTYLRTGHLLGVDETDLLFPKEYSVQRETQTVDTDGIATGV